MKKGKSDDTLSVLPYSCRRWSEGLRTLGSASEGAEEKYIHILLKRIEFREAEETLIRLGVSTNRMFLVWNSVCNVRNIPLCRHYEAVLFYNSVLQTISDGCWD